MSEIESTYSTSNPKMGNYDLGASNRLFLDVYGDQKQKNKKQSKHPMKLIETKNRACGPGISHGPERNLLVMAITPLRVTLPVFAGFLDL
jgi:hypothetical protein